MMLLPLDSSLVCVAPEPDALVVDTGVVTDQRVLLRSIKRPLVVSSITYAELIQRYVDKNARGVVDALLRSASIKVVPLEPDDVATYATLQERLHATLVLRGTNSQNAAKQVNANQHDLLIFATAVRRHLKVVTKNTNDFELFEPRDAWMTVAELRSMSQA